MSPGRPRGHDIGGLIHILEGMLAHPLNDGKAVGRLHGFGMRV